MADGRGTLFLVVGPSGAGKDTVIGEARRTLAGNPDYVFPTREITRPADAGGEDHHPVTEDTFERRAAAGKYAFHWRANGLSYGVPASVLKELDHGRHVVVNVSRTIIKSVRERISPLRILLIDVEQDILRERLNNRGRETRDDVIARLRRAARYTVAGEGVTTVCNSGSVEDGVAAFLSALSA